LIAAAHASSFSLALSKELGLKTIAKGEIVTTATVTLEPDPIPLDVKVAVDDVSSVGEGVLVIEGEELILDGNVWIGSAGDRREQVESAAEFLVKDGAG